MPGAEESVPVNIERLTEVVLDTPRLSYEGEQACIVYWEDHYSLDDEHRDRSHCLGTATGTGRTAVHTRSGHQSFSSLKT